MIAYLDSGVLLHAWRGSDLSGAALAAMSAEKRELVTSQLVRLELLPKPACEKRPAETAFYAAHFEAAAPALPLDGPLGEEALALAQRYGLAAVDALHIAAALRQHAGEFYTSEKPGKPMFRVKELKVISLHEITAAN
ncbi:MAG: PIN domain-containing protein [Limisphaerales bacterium]